MGTTPYRFGQVLHSEFAAKMFLEMVGAIIGLVIVIFFMWLFYVYVTSRRDWLEEDVRIRRSKVSHNLARAEQIRLESLALKDRLEKSGIDTKPKDFF